MALVELWVLLNTGSEEYHYIRRRLTQIQRKFPLVTSDINELAIVIGLQSTYSVRKTTKNQAEALSIEYRTNLSDDLKGSGKVPAAMHVRNMQSQEVDRTLN